MPDMPEMMAQGDFFRRLDTALNSPKRQHILQELRALGDGAAALAALATKYGVFTNAKEEAHFRDDWLTNWWPSAQPVAPIIRMTLIQAIEVASGELGTVLPHTKPVPICTLWTCNAGSGDIPDQPPTPGSTDGPVQAGISWTEHQVTIVIDTPDAPVEDEGELTGKEPIWIVRRKDGEVVVLRP